MKSKIKANNALLSLERGSLGKQCPIYPGDKEFFVDMGGGVLANDLFRQYLPDFKSQIIMVSRAFMSAMEKAYPQLMSLYKDIAINDISDISVCGTFILPDRIAMIKHLMKKGTEDVGMAYMVFDKNMGTPLSFYQNDIFVSPEKFGWFSNNPTMQRNISQFKSLDHVSAEILSKCVMISMFMKYASVETKIVGANKKEKINQEKVFNETPFDIIYLDSKWFTTIVRTEGFSVRGHFRFQPKKVGGEWTKELIWINEFQKHGYTSRAKILSQDHD